MISNWNVAFGYLMNAWGSSTSEAKWDGALLNLYDGLYSPSSAFKGPAFTGYDAPRDFEAIELGGQLYARRRSRLNAEFFRDSFVGFVCCLY